MADTTPFSNTAIDERCDVLLREMDNDRKENEISDAAFTGYTDPANELPYESREGGYQGEVFHSYELIEELGDWTHSDALVEDVYAAFSDSVWCRENYFGVDAASRLRYGWDDFCPPNQAQDAVSVPAGRT